MFDNFKLTKQREKQLKEEIKKSKEEYKALQKQKKEKTSIFNKCNLCGSRNVVLNEYGVCQACEIKQLKNALLPEYNNLEYLTNEIEKENITLSKIKQEITEKEDKLKSLIQIDKENETLLTLKEEISICEKKLTSLNQEIIIKEKEVFTLDDTILLQNFGLYEPTYDFALSIEYKEELNKIRNKQKEMVRNKTAVEYFDGWTVNGSKAEGRKMTNSNIKQILRTFNNECDTLIEKAKFNNIDKIKQRIEKSYEQLNKMNDSVQIKLTPAYLKLKFDELTLAYEYQVKKQQEKEEERERREALREQQKLEKEIREAREKILKEKKHFNNAIKEAQKQLDLALNEDERTGLLEKIKELEQQLKDIDSEEKVIDYREKNAKAGYVYIISNIGAFGEDVYKIGMTRRLEPMDRIKELGDASVPFSFDVHALIFSEDAPKLESKLHEHFFNDRINKLNNRKEFYKTKLEEIEKVVKENYDKTVEFTEIAQAEQYRQSIRIK